MELEKEKSEPAESLWFIILAPSVPIHSITVEISVSTKLMDKLKPTNNDKNVMDMQFKSLMQHSHFKVSILLHELLNFLTTWRKLVLFFLASLFH